jgi:hypothetical protein
MIKIDNLRVFNMEGAFRGLRNPMNSWDKSDSISGIGDYDQFNMDVDNIIGTYIKNAFGDHYNDWLEEDGWQDEYDEMAEHLNNWYAENATLDWDGRASTYFLLGYNDKLLAQRMVLAGADEGKFARQIFVSLDIEAPLLWWKEFDTYKVATVANSCSTMHKIHSRDLTMDDFTAENFSEETMDLFQKVVDRINKLRALYLETKDKSYWREMIDLLPESYMQKRTVTLNYQNLRNIYFARRHHKLNEWHDFCRMIEGLPYAANLICCEKEKKV